MKEYSVACRRCHHGWTTEGNEISEVTCAGCGSVAHVTGSFKVVSLR